ncbi:adenosylcobinamide-phosphate synthase CbiB [Clostridium sp. Marseille-P2415]|uniref:adenosylcobinamide-phosphate synthase CbiB n=1 Tax=Clostridium sp. Marseille-P2415 TaxID=1805471 RepID=UPI0009886EB0|nr:adenosylcobinamide-phosphate synthase CbiB [Clostridium sp. Marseille-P2415]
MIRLHLLAVLTGCFLDMCLGDPHWIWHPVCGIGSLISRLEKWLRKRFPQGKEGELAAGTWLVVIVLFTTGAISAAVFAGACFLSPYAGFFVESMMCCQMMAWRSLRTESMKVYKAFNMNDVEEARKAVSMIVGRDTKTLTGTGITKAAVETVAENTSDGIIAPLLAMTLFGGPGVFLYKAVNTMDSMVGYKNDRYLWFGRAAARLDDICNFIPARLSAVFMIGAGYVCQFFYGLRGKKENPYNGRNGIKIFKRDRFKHKSPNSAQTEAVCAGVLQIELAGNAFYFGKLYEKPTIGDAIRPVEHEDIRRANCLMTVTYLLALVPVLILFIIVSL